MGVAMGHKTVVFLVSLYAIIALGGCGGGGGGSAVPSDPDAVASVTATASKAVVLADNSDFAQITAAVTKNAGGPAADGTPVTFAVSSSSATIFDATSTVTSGTATAKVRRAAIASPGSNETVAVTASAGSATSAPVSVKFINKPDTATVQVALNTPVTDLGVLVFDLTPGAGATFSTVKGINEAATSNYVGFINPAVPSNTFTVLNASGMNVPANSNILEFTYAIGQITSLPVFQVTGNVTATTATGSTITLSPSNFVVATKFNTE